MLATLRTHLTGFALLALPLSLVACAKDEPAPPRADRAFRDFQLVYPVLLRDCGFHACHGATERFLRVVGPGRVRLDADTEAFDGATGDEAGASYQSALTMLDAEHPERSLLLVKPLAIEAGGASHGGNDPFGRNVYRTAQDEGYLALARFVFAIPEPDDD
jgi:hypothetical protein